MQRLFQIAFTIVVVLSSSNVALGTIPRPRGVSISKASLYPPGEHFVCFDGLRTINFLQINDDFCDCVDGSDEPGTSACPGGKFHCTNAGYRTKNIPSSRVNDGICDCCDASDEYGYPDSKCVNTCLELGREERLHKKSREEVIKRGNALKAELSAKGKILRTERDAKLVELQSRHREAITIQQEKEKIKKEAEDIENEALQVYKDIQESDTRDKAQEEAAENTSEAEKTFTKFDSNKDGSIEIAELQTRISFDKDRNGAVSEEEAKFFLDERERVDLETFTTICWSRIKPYLMMDEGLFKPPQLPGEPVDEHDIDDLDAEAEIVDSSHEEPALHHDSELDEDTDGGYEPEEEEEEELGEGAVEEVTTPKPEYDPETQKLIEQADAARKDFLEAEQSIRVIDQEIKEIEEQIGKDYGTVDEFAPLEGQCFTFEDREYVYKLCPFDRASQQPRNGGSETRLGTWSNWSGTDYKYSHMLYSNGSPCWNGPQRSVVTQLECGLDHKLTAVSEPNRCEYHFVFETPAACENLEDRADELVHDEL